MNRMDELKIVDSYSNEMNISCQENSGAVPFIPKRPLLSLKRRYFRAVLEKRQKNSYTADVGFFTRLAPDALRRFPPPGGKIYMKNGKK